MVIHGDDQLAVGLGINAKHIRPVKDGFVNGAATSEALGRTTQVWTIGITEEQDLVCISLLTTAVIPMGDG